MTSGKSRTRRGESLPDAATLILRGGLLSPDELVSTAADNFEIYGYFGISVFAATSLDSFAAVASGRLRRHKTLAIFRAEDVLGAGLELWDTGRAPHYDVVHEREDELVSRLLACPHRFVANDRFVPPDGGDGHGR